MGQTGKRGKYTTFPQRVQKLCREILNDRVQDENTRGVVWIPAQPFVASRGSMAKCALDSLLEKGVVKAVDYKSAEPWMREEFLRVRPRTQGINLIYVVWDLRFLREKIRETCPEKQRRNRPLGILPKRLTGRGQPGYSAPE